MRPANSAITALFLTLHPKLLEVVRSRTRRGRGEAEDITGETWKRLCEHVFEEGRLPPGADRWLFRVAINLCVDLHRHIVVQERATEMLRRPQARGGGADEEVARREALQRLHVLLAAAPLRLRQWVTLYLEDVGREEIAERMGLSVKRIDQLREETFRLIEEVGRREGW